MSQLINYQDIDLEISEASVKKFSIYLWYLASETVALSIFDDNVPKQVKTNIARVMLETDEGRKGKEANERDAFCTKMTFLPLSTSSVRLF